MAADETTLLRARVAELEEENRQLREALVPADFEVSSIGGVHLPRKAARVFACLRKHGVVSKAQLFTALFGVGAEQDPKNVDVYIYKLRRKLKPLGFRIETVWGQGYRLKEPSTMEPAA